jgi:hypothetical protein
MCDKDCNSCINCKCFQFYYKFSKLLRYKISDKFRIKTFIYEGDVFKDEACTKKLGKILIEQTINTFLNDTVTNHTVELPDGFVSYRLFHRTADGKAKPGDVVVGPFICGSQKFLHWNSSKYFSKVTVGADDDLRSVIIFKKKC